MTPEGGPRQRAYNKGHEEGYSAGLDEGFAKGLSQGQEEAHTDAPQVQAAFEEECRKAELDEGEEIWTRGVVQYLIWCRPEVVQFIYGHCAEILDETYGG